MSEKKLVHFRRCHMCGAMNEKKNCIGSSGPPLRVEQCEDCLQFLVPFFFCNEKQVEGLSDQSRHRPSTLSPEGFSAIWGLSLFWSDEDLPEILNN
jgi:hypothetical protein